MKKYLLVSGIALALLAVQSLSAQDKPAAKKDSTAMMMHKHMKGKACAMCDTTTMKADCQKADSCCQRGHMHMKGKSCAMCDSTSMKMDCKKADSCCQKNCGMSHPKAEEKKSEKK